MPARPVASIAHWLIKPNNCLFAEGDKDKEEEGREEAIAICTRREKWPHTPLLSWSGRARLINHPRLVANSAKLFTQLTPIAKSNGSQPALPNCLPDVIKKFLPLPYPPLRPCPLVTLIKVRRASAEWDLLPLRPLDGSIKPGFLRASVLSIDRL